MSYNTLYLTSDACIWSHSDLAQLSKEAFYLLTQDNWEEVKHLGGPMKPFVAELGAFLQRKPVSPENRKRLAMFRSLFVGGNMTWGVQEKLNRATMWTPGNLERMLIAARGPGIAGSFSFHKTVDGWIAQGKRGNMEGEVHTCEEDGSPDEFIAMIAESVKVVKGRPYSVTTQVIGLEYETPYLKSIGGTQVLVDGAECHIDGTFVRLLQFNPVEQTLSPVRCGCGCVLVYDTGIPGFVIAPRASCPVFAAPIFLVAECTAGMSEVFVFSGTFQLDDCYEIALSSPPIVLTSMTLPDSGVIVIDDATCGLLSPPLCSMGVGIADLDYVPLGSDVRVFTPGVFQQPERSSYLEGCGAIVFGRSPDVISDSSTKRVVLVAGGQKFVGYYYPLSDATECVLDLGTVVGPRKYLVPSRRRYYLWTPNGTVEYVTNDSRFVAEFAAPTIRASLLHRDSPPGTVFSLLQLDIRSSRAKTPMIKFLSGSWGKFFLIEVFPESIKFCSGGVQFSVPLSVNMYAVIFNMTRKNFEFFDGKVVPRKKGSPLHVDLKMYGVALDRSMQKRVSYVFLDDRVEIVTWR